MTAQSNSSQYEPLEPYDTMTGTAIAISDADEAEALSEYLTSPDRQHPAVVVTRRFGKPLFDAKSLASNLHDVAAVFDLVTPKATWGLSAALPEGTAMTRTQFDSMQELVEFITDDDGHIDESAADEVFQYLTQLQGEARHLRESLKVSNDRLESMKQKMMQKQRENSYSDGRQYYKSPLPLFADKAEGKRFEREQMDMLVRREWATRFGPEEKKSHALPRTWAYSDWFFDTLASTHISVSKVVAVMVEVLTGLDIELAGREGLQHGDFGGDYRLAFHQALRGDRQFAQGLGPVFVRVGDGGVTLITRIDVTVVDVVDQQVLPSLSRTILGQLGFRSGDHMFRLGQTILI